MKRSKKGFTLAELLVVVAIIAVLVAIAIPVFSAQLEKSKIAADEANVRAWYAEVVVDYLTCDDQSSYTDPTAYNNGVTGYPDLVADGATVTIDGALADGDFNVTYSATKLDTDLVIGKQ